MQLNFKINHKIIFTILVIVPLILILKIFNQNFMSLKIKDFIATIKPVYISIALDNSVKLSDKDEFYLCLNKHCYTPNNEESTNIYKFSSNSLKKYNYSTDEVYILFNKKEVENAIFKVCYRVGSDLKYFNKAEIQNFTKTTKQVNNKYYNSIILPKINNDGGIKNYIPVCILSLFYNWQLFIIPYIVLIFALIFYILNKEKIGLNFNISTTSAVWFFVFIAVILRAINLDDYFLRTDEAYTMNVAIKSLHSVFNDPGNPPLFFFLEYLQSKIIVPTKLSIRFIPMISGVLSSIFIYLIFKKSGKFTSLFALFLSAIDLSLIYKSQEARGYSLSVFITIFSLYLLFNYINKPTTKRLILYLISVIMLVNNYYYLMIVAFGNLIYGIFGLNSSNKNKLKVFIAGNICAFLTATPYLFISFKEAIGNEFNTWISELSFGYFNYTIQSYFCNKYLLVFFCLLILLNLYFVCKKPMKIDENKKDLFYYSLYILEFVLICVFAISIIIKPIFAKRFLMSIYGYLLILEVIVITTVFELSKFTNKIKILYIFYFITTFIFYLTITTPVEYEPILFNLFDYKTIDIKNTPKYIDASFKFKH